jgi:hypothetical protein
MAFACFVGNQSVIADAKRSFEGSRMTLVVGPPSGGKTTFVGCLEQHFKERMRFERPCLDGGDLRTTLWSAASRKAGVMESYCRGVEFVAADHDKALRVILDDVDVGEKNLAPLLEEILEGTPRTVGFVVVVDSAGVRKMSLLKKKGALVLGLTNPAKDAVQRWARRVLLPAEPAEEEHERLKALMRATGLSIRRLKKAYELGQTVQQVRDDVECASPENVDNSTTLAKLFSERLDIEWLLQAVSMDGGSMLGQLAWHNSAAIIADEGRYARCLEASIRGMVVERACHLRHDPVGSALGHALTLSPFAGVCKSVDRSAMTYTTTMAHGGARAVARRALATATDDLSVAERAWASCRAADKPRKRCSRKK